MTLLNETTVLVYKDTPVVTYTCLSHIYSIINLPWAILMLHFV